MSMLSKHRPNAHRENPRERVPILIHPEVRDRLNNLLHNPELKGVGYSSFIERACEIAETEIAERITRRSES